MIHRLLITSLLVGLWTLAPAFARVASFGAAGPGTDAPLHPSTIFAAPQVFRAGTDTVLLSVTVNNSKNKPITNLAREDFRIFEDGVAQDISVFAGDRQPIALSLLLDSSASMEGKLDVAQQAAVGFAQRLGARDVAQVIDFNSDTRVRQTFTNHIGALEEAIRQIRMDGGTALYTALYIAIQSLNSAPPPAPSEIRRQAIIVLSDGEDTRSRLTYEDVAESAKRSPIAIYAIGLHDKVASEDRRFNEADFALRSLSQVTGGRVFFVDDVRQLTDIYSQISEELANQYVIGYTSKNQKRDGTWRQVAVRVGRPDVVARTRSGYFAPTSRSAP